MSYESLLTQTCTVQTKSDDYVTEGSGAITETWADTYTNVPCRIWNTMGTLLEESRGQNKQSTHVMFVKTSQTVAVGNRVVDENSVKYLVDYVDAIEARSSAKTKEILMHRFGD